MIQPSRRGFLKALLALPAAATVDFERLLWTPSPTITVPTLVRSVSLNEINRVTAQTFLPGIVDNLFAPSPLMAYLKGECAVPIKGGDIVGIQGRPLGVALEDGQPGEWPMIQTRGRVQVRLVEGTTAEPPSDLPIPGTYGALTRRTW